jgi:hypothetical protein
MAPKARSPQYPALSLEEAISHVSTIFKKFDKQSLDREAVADAIGYKVISGKAQAALSALVKYGLLTYEGASYKLTKISLMLNQEKKHDERHKRAVIQAAENVSLFNEIDRCYQGDDKFDLHTWLLSNKFTEDAARTVERLYLNRNQYMFNEYGLKWDYRPLAMRYVLKAEPGIYRLTASDVSINITRKEVIALKEGTLFFLFPTICQRRA